jgi:RNA polymerase sigma factor (TIGR02999 family)
LSATILRRKRANETDNMSVEALDQWVKAADAGSVEQRQQLFAALYNELHRLAQRELRRNAQATLSPTTLLHETFLNMCMRDSAPATDRGRFMAYAARAMRGLLLNYLRDRQAQKRGGQFEITSLPTELQIVQKEEFDDAKLSEALDALARVDARLAECVDLKFFCGFTFADIAEMRSVSERTVQRDWEKARILLHQFLDTSVA